MKAKRRLYLGDLGGIKPQEVPQVETPVVNPEAERLERLRQNAAKIIQENAAVEQQRVDLRTKRIDAVRASCSSSEFVKVEHLVDTAGYLPADIESAQAYEWALRVVINERTR